VPKQLTWLNERKSLTKINQSINQPERSAQLQQTGGSQHTNHVVLFQFTATSHEKLTQ